MTRVTKRYLATLGLGLACPVLIAAAAVRVIGAGESAATGLIAGIMIVGSFAVTAGLVAREKGRSLWYALAGWIAPLLPIILLLPHTKKRRAELMGIAQSPESGEGHGVTTTPGS